MLTRLNTLYVLTQGTYLSKEGECVQLRTEAGKKLLPIHLLGGATPSPSPASPNTAPSSPASKATPPATSSSAAANTPPA